MNYVKDLIQCLYIFKICIMPLYWLISSFLAYIFIFHHIYFVFLIKAILPHVFIISYLISLILYMKLVNLIKYDIKILKQQCHYNQFFIYNLYGTNHFTFYAL